MSKNEVDTIKEIIEVNNKFILSEIQGGNDLIKSKLNVLIEQQKMTNGRVTENEKNIQRMKNNPALKPILKRPYLFVILGILFSLIILGFVSVSQIFEILNIIK